MAATLLVFAAVLLVTAEAVRRAPRAARGPAPVAGVEQLPEIVEALALCAEAGLDHLHALERILEAAPPSPLAAELRRTVSEARAGAGKADSWRRFAERVPHEEVRLFTGLLVRADVLGATAAAGLQGLATAIRERRFRAAERHALEAPVKLLLPMGFSFLAIFVLLGGALYLDFVSGGGLR